MIREDYFMRMVEVLTRAIARIIALKDAGSIDGALEEMRTTARTLLGIELGVIDSLGGDDTMALLSPGGHFDAAKCYAIGMLLDEEAGLLEKRDGEAATVRRSMKALRLLTEGLLDAGKPLTPGHLDAIDRLLRRVEAYELPAGLPEKALRCFELGGRFDRAEDLLYDVIDADERGIEAGIGFYERLLKKTDPELERGNLPRSEIEEGLAVLRKRAIAERSPTH